MKHMKRYALPAVAAAAILGVASPKSSASTEHTPAVWQWAVPVQGGTDRDGASTAYLWVPQSCRRLRGVVVAQNNMEEESILESPIFRKAMAKLDFGEVWVSPAFSPFFRFDQGAGDVFNSFMNNLASTSGYSELSFVPVVAMGHSAQASWPYYLAAWNNNRVLACLSVSGQWPYWRDKTFAPDIWGDRNIDGVPCLESMGEYEAADTWSREGLYERKMHPKLPLSMLANPAQGHFAATDVKIEYLAFYIAKAAHYRIPENWNGRSAPTLIPIDPTKTGWLADKWRKDQVPIAPPAPVGQYKGDADQAFWFFDKETAERTAEYESAYRSMKPDLLGYTQDGRLVPQTNTHQQVNLRFEPEADGVTFHLTGEFLDTVPGESERPASWTGLPAGSPIGHSSNVKISIDPIAGPVAKIDDDTFALRLEKGLGPGLNHYELWFAATNAGDSEYKPAVQQSMMFVPLRNNEGSAQSITFPAIPDQKSGVRKIRLNAASDSGLPVYYYVESGPAVMVNGDTLLLTQVPPRAKYPVKVAVVAWQYGRSIEPKIKTAEPITRTFYIRK